MLACSTSLIFQMDMNRLDLSLLEERLEALTHSITSHEALERLVIKSQQKLARIGAEGEVQVEAEIQEGSLEQQLEVAQVELAAAVAKERASGKDVGMELQ